MSKLSFRARALDASKPMPVYLSEELPDLPDYSAINRAVPQMPSGMEKEEECEHHLQRAICTGLIIPTPEVLDLGDQETFIRAYRADYKMPRQLIHMQPLAMEQDIPDYDMDSSDETWVQEQSRRLELTPLQFEHMMDRLEKSSEQTVVTLHEAKALLKQDDELIIAVYDYWLNKRLKTQHPLILAVKTEHRGGAANNPYLAFRRRTEKMQTRKNRKNDETSYEKMLKLRRDLCRTLTLLELTKKREEIKKKLLQNEIELNEKRYQAKDFSGQIINELSALKSARPAFAPLFTNQFPTQANTWTSNQHFSQSSLPFKSLTKTEKDRDRDEYIPRREKRQYKKRKHKNNREKSYSGTGPPTEPLLSSEEEESTIHPCSEPEEDGTFNFRRSKNSNYHMPRSAPNQYVSPEDRGHPFAMTSLRLPKRICLGMSRRRVGRGGRYLLDRAVTTLDDIWATFDYTIQDNVINNSDKQNIINISAQEKSDINSFKTSQILRNEKTELNTSSQVIAEIAPKVRSKRPPHFRPLTPPVCPESELRETPVIAPNQLLSVEIQNLSKKLPSYVLPQSDPFLTSEFTLQDFKSASNFHLEDTTDFGDSISFTMPSFNDSDSGSGISSINMGDGVLDNILSESQINDLKSLHGSTTSLSDLLDDPLGNNLLNLSDDMESSDLMLDKPKLNIGDKEKNDLFQHNIDLVNLNHMSSVQAGFNSEFITICTKDNKTLPTDVNRSSNHQNINGRNPYIVNTLASPSGSSKFIIINHDEESTILQANDKLKDATIPKITSVSKNSLKSQKIVSATFNHPKPQQSLLNKNLLQKSVTLKGKHENNYTDHSSVEPNSNGPSHEVRILSSRSSDRHNLLKLARQKHASIQSITGIALSSQSSGMPQYSIDLLKSQNAKSKPSINDVNTFKKSPVVSNIQDSNMKTNLQTKNVRSHHMAKQNMASMNVINRHPPSNLSSNAKAMQQAGASNLPKQLHPGIGQTGLGKTIQQMPKSVLPGMPGVPGIPGMPGMTGIPGKKPGQTTLASRIQAVSNSQLVKLVQGENTLNSNR